MQVQIYFRDSDKPLWEDFKRICTRENSSASDKIQKFVNDYVSSHKYGNPQMVMEHYPTKDIEKEVEYKPKPVPKFENLSTEELIEMKKNPRTPYGIHMILTFHLKKRGYSTEQIRRMIS